ncbi:type I secretion membrane fusion protein, HlyD family [Rhizobiales bacterium GAS113]|nr:type I secretion membrane fusion protein, HlyD family [Rhizobiales bacterium GAS113]
MRSARNIVAFPGEGKAPGGGKALGGGKTSRGGTNSGEDKRGQRDELAFLPAALEIVETPPSPTGRAIAITLIALFCLALAWASLGQVDIVASAPGKIVPTGRSKVIQPFETGVVRAIHVKDGQSVTAGETLIELDPTINEADGNRLRSDLMAARLDIARLRAALAGTADPLADFAPPAEAASAVIATQRQFLMNMLEEHRAKLAALDRQRTQKEAERASIAATIDKLQATIPIHQERVDIRKLLYDHQNGSKLIYLEDLQSLVENQRELVVAKSRYREAEAATAAIVETRAQMEAEYRRGLSGELAEAERKAAGLTEDLVKAEQRTKLQLLAAPVDGMVQQLAVHTVGGVVTPAQTLLVIAPTDSRLEIEAMVSNRDIGFIHVQLHEIRGRSRRGAQRVPGCDCTRQASRQVGRDPGRSRRWQRATRPGAGLRGACVSRQVADPGGRWPRQSIARHGRYRRDQNRGAQDHQLLALAFAQLPPGEPEGEMIEVGLLERTRIRFLS